MSDAREPERVLPEGVIDADPAGGWDGVDDAETQSQSDASAQEFAETPVEGAIAGQGADPDLVTDAQADDEQAEAE